MKMHSSVFALLAIGVGMVSAAPQQVQVSAGEGALEKAQAEVRRIIRANGGKVPTGGIEVVLADGVYRLDRPICFTEIDSGTNGSPIVWRAAHRGKAVISGAAEVTESKVDFSAMPASLIPEASRADTRAWHISGTNNIPGWRQGWRQGNLTEIPVQVHANGRRLKVATYPKQEFARTGRTVKPVVDSYNEWGENWYANFDGEFYVENIPQLGLWAKEPDLWAFGMWRFEWSATTSPVLKIDPEQKIMCVDTNQNAYGFLPNVPFNVFNAFSEIKEKGEWALDRKARMLYVRDAERPDVSMAERLFTSWPTIHDVIFQDLVFEHARGQAIRFYNARRVTVRASLFRGIGDTAVIFGADSREAVIHGCDFEDLGKGAVNIRGGEQATLTPASNVVENCHIHHFGQVSPIANPAISMSGVGCRAQHNLIHHFAHQGIVYIGNDHYCGFNMIHDGVMYNNDAGSIYCGSYDWSRRGSVCEYNCIFMSGKQPLSSHVQGIYMDGWTSGVTVRGNIVNRASQGIYTSGGNDNVVVDNLIVNCQLGINLSSLGADSFAKGAALKGKDSFLYKKLLAGEKLYRSELWRTRYPRLLDLLAFEDKVEAHNAYWYKCTNNVMCATTGLRVGNAEKVLPTHFMTNNVELTGDPGFIDYEGFNWELKPDAPARKVLPQGTRFGEMGLYDSPWRFSPAVKHGANMSRPRPIRTEFDQGTVVVSFNVPGRQGSRWMSVNTATPQWREYVVELKAEADGPYRLNLIGGCGYKTAYDDVRIEGHPEFRGDFEEGAKGWTWNKQERPSSKGEQGTPHGIVEMADAASGSHVALANDRNVVTSPPFTMKKGEMIRVTLKAREYIPEFILPYWNR
ncbi:MAG: right-handed parallel beta-helix repeat-containing protein [Kiritimatiellae bacterium]|nr:right-handed parallel beta-helix repeat-containing protein [Kiritimatiellia bacterium]